MKKILHITGLSILLLISSSVYAASISITPNTETNAAAFITETGWQVTCSSDADAPPGYISFEMADHSEGGHWRNDLGPGWCNPGPASGFTLSSFSYSPIIDGTYAITSCDEDPGTGNGCPSDHVIATAEIAVGSSPPPPPPPPIVISFNTSTTTCTSDGTTTTCATIGGTQTVDNPTQDLYAGFILFYIVAGGLIWFFRKR